MCSVWSVQTQHPPAEQNLSAHLLQETQVYLCFFRVYFEQLTLDIVFSVLAVPHGLRDLSFPARPRR